MPDEPGSDTSPEKSAGARPPAPADTVVQQGFPPVARDPSAPAPPGYELLAEVGRGGMGVVYRARDLALGRDVAVKLLQDRYTADGPVTRQFIEEAQITGQLVHPGVPPIHQVGTLPDGRPFLVMKLIKGHTLDVLLAEGADRDRLLSIFENLCGTVGYAHERGVIHRDLKPSNVMVGAFGEVQVMDWGLAKVLRSDGPNADRTVAAFAHSELRVPASTDTVVGSVMGTLGYMSPEQAGGELAKIDRRTDVFALGGILCTVLTGRPPYTGADASEVHLKAVRGQTTDCFAALDACGAEPELVALCKRCLSAEPDSRPKDAGAVAKAVADFRRALEDRTHQSELERVRAEAEERAIRRSQSQVSALAEPPASRFTRRAVLFGAPVVAAGAVGGYFAFRTGEPAPLSEGITTSPPPPPPVPVPEPVPPAVLCPVREFDHRVAAVAVSADARWLAVGFLREEPPQGGVKLFDRAKLGAEVWWKWQDTECRGVAFSPDGKLLAVATGGSGRLRVWSFAEQKERELPGATFSGTARSVAFSPGGRWLAVAVDQWDNEDRTPRPGLVRVWEVGTSAKPRDLVRLNYPARTIAFADDGTTLVVGMHGRENDWVPSIAVWNAATGRHLKALAAPLAVTGPAVACSQGAPVCAAADREGVKLYSLPSFDPHPHELASMGEASAIALSRDGTTAAVASEGVIRLWNVATGIGEVLGNHPGDVSALAFTLDGKTLISGGLDRTVREWAVRASATK